MNSGLFLLTREPPSLLASFSFSFSCHLVSTAHTHIPVGPLDFSCFYFFFFCVLKLGFIGSPFDWPTAPWRCAYHSSSSSSRRQQQQQQQHQRKRARDAFGRQLRRPGHARPAAGGWSLASHPLPPASLPPLFSVAAVFLFSRRGLTLSFLASPRNNRAARPPVRPRACVPVTTLLSASFFLSHSLRLASPSSSRQTIHAAMWCLRPEPVSCQLLLPPSCASTLALFLSCKRRSRRRPAVRVPARCRFLSSFAFSSFFYAVFFFFVSLS